MTYRRPSSSGRRSSFMSTMRSGFNRFQELNFSHSAAGKSRERIASSPDNSSHLELQIMLRTKRQHCQQIKVELKKQRDFQYSDYVKKSFKYQELLDINDHKKKRLPTLNAKIGEVIKISASDQQTKIVEYSLLTEYFHVDQVKPQTREGHTTTAYHNTVVVIGGHCSAPFPFAYIFSLANHSWTKQFPMPSARSYHSTVLYKNRYAIVFGGMGPYDLSRKCRVCYNSVNVVDLHTQTGRVLKMGSEQLVEARRSHACALMGKYMLVFGGLNTKRQYLKDFVYLDLKQLRWYQKQYRSQGKDLIDDLNEGLAKGKAVMHFKETRKTYPLYSSEYNDFEGLYIFGGMFGNGSQNILCYMGFNTYNPCIRKVIFSGLPPASSNISVQKINQNLVFLMSGELNDRMVKLYRIKQREFVGIYKYHNDPFLGGVGCTMTACQEGLIVLFGLGENGYNSEVACLKLQQKYKWEQSEMKRNRKGSNEEWKIYNKTTISESDSN